MGPMLWQPYRSELNAVCGCTVACHMPDLLCFNQIDQWLDFSTSIVSGAGLEAVCGVVDTFLSLRTFLVGYSLTIADLQVWGQLQGDFHIF